LPVWERLALRVASVEDHANKRAGAVLGFAAGLSFGAAGALPSDGSRNAYGVDPAHSQSIEFLANWLGPARAMFAKA